MESTLHRSVSRIAIALLFSLFAGGINLYGQCADNNSVSPFNPDLTPPGQGLSDSYSCAWAGDYFYFSCVAGQTYEISACASTNGNDPIFTLYNHVGGAYITHNDNFCGNYPQITWLATYTGQARIVVDEGGASCTHSSVCIDVKVTWLDPCSGGGAPTVNVVQDTAISCNGGTGSIIANITGGSPNYNYAWSTGASTLNTASTSNGLYALTAGTYTVTISDGNTCTATASYTLTEPSAVNASVSSQTNVACFGNNTGALTAAGSGGTGSLSYLWSNGANTATTTGLAAGTYTCTVTDANSCTATTSATITQPASAVSASVTAQTNVLCFGTNTGSITAAGSGGTGGYNYAWSNGATTATTSGLVAGTYTCTVTDANSCTATTSTTVTEPASPVSASITAQTNVNCNGGNDGALTAAGSGGAGSYTYAWSNGATTASTSSLAAGTYTCTVTDANSCTATTSGTITQPTALSGSITAQTNVSCNGGTDGSLTAAGSGGSGSYTYAWSNGGVSATTSGLAAGTYTVTITDANSCTATTSSTVTEPATPVSASVNVDNNATCGASNGQLTASGSGGTGGYAYAWNTGATTATISGLAASTYTVTVTDGNGCTATANGTVTSAGGPSISITAQTNVSCNGGGNGSLTSTATGGAGGYTYLWSNGATTATASGLAANTYTVTVTDGNSCTATTSGTVTEPAVLNASISGQTNVSCNAGTNGSLTAAGSGGTGSYTYVWSNGATTATTTGLSVGTYTCTITDANNCTATTSSTVTEPTAVVASITGQTNVSCNGGTDGSLTVSPSGGTSGYTFLWSNGATTAANSGLAAGTYTVTVTDANSCTATTSGTVTEPSTAVSASVNVDSNATCGASNGQLTASGSGGTGGYTYAWSNGATTATTSGLAAATYTVTVTDGNGCTATSNGVVTNAGSPTVSISAQTNVSCNGGSNGSLTAAGSGGTGSYTYLWSNGATTAATSGLVANTYTVTVTDGNGCTGTTNATVTEPSVLMAAAVVDSNVSCNGLSDGGMSASGSGGAGGYSYAWSNGATTASITGIAAGSYTVTVTDANGCTATSNGSVTEPSVLLATAVVDSNVSCNGFSDGGMTSSGTGGTGAYSYAWSNGATTASVTGIAAGTYTVTLTDANGCTATASGSVTEPTAMTVTVTVDSTADCGGLGGLTAAATGGTSGYTYSWNTGATTASITGLAAGTYTVLATDANGCLAFQNGVITGNSGVTVTLSPITTALCEDGSPETLSASPSGGTFSGTGVSGSSFDPAAAGAGTHTIYYNFTDSLGCTGADSMDVTVGATPIVVMMPPGDFCSDDSPTNLTATPGGGTFSGNGMNGSFFDPSIAGAGTHTIVYSYTNAQGCTGTDTLEITVTAQVTIAFDPVPNPICLEGGKVDLTATPAGGSWSGTGIVGSSFDPAVSGTGTFTVFYTVSNAVCTTTDSLDLTVDICDAVEDGFFAAVRLYPNPNQGAFRVEGLPAGAKVRMLNSLGQSVFGRDADGDNMDIRVELPAGIYYLEIRKDERVLRKRVVLQ